MFNFQQIRLISLERYSLEFWWTLLPIIILFSLALPRIRLLYISETPYISPKLSLKVIGYQWYWGYQLSDFKNIEFDSYILSNLNSENNNFRNLEVDNRVVLPINVVSRIIVTSNDVLHSWALPSFISKVDANPGRLNILFLNSLVPGIFYGQCREICGANHSFIPIVLEFSSSQNFKLWLNNFS